MRVFCIRARSCSRRFSTRRLDRMGGEACLDDTIRAGPNLAKGARAVSMGGSNEFVECFCWGAVVEGGSGAVVQFIDDGFDAGLVGGDGVRLGR